MSLEVALSHRMASFDIDARFHNSGRFTALFGPSGCGKTTIVNMVAGLVKPDFARIVCDGEVLADTDRGIWLPPHKRQIGYVFQDSRLLPHLTVGQNLRYGKWFASGRDRYASESDVVTLLGLTQLLRRMPEHLSGGERQRVAIGRALLQSPRLLLMDEPLASLDESRKSEILPYIERLRDEAKVPVIYVSHAINEVTRLASDMVLMSNGRVLESGPLEDVLPKLSGVNSEIGKEAGSLVIASLSHYDETDDLTTLESGVGRLRIAGRLGSAGSRFRLHIRANDITLATDKPGRVSALNIIEGRVVSIANTTSSSASVTIACGHEHLHAGITRYSALSLGLVPGTTVYAIIKAMAVRPIPTETRNEDTIPAHSASDTPRSPQ